MKRCSNKNCSHIEAQPLENFYKRKDRKCGILSICKSCEKIRQKNKLKNKQIEAVKSKKWRDNHPGYNARICKNFHLKNPNYSKNRRRNNINARLSERLRSRLKEAMAGNYKSGSAIKDLGCSIEFFKQYLESKFRDGMNWENYGFYGWHIDHIKPLCKFDLTNKDEFVAACHYTNLQPLWALDNLKKSGKF